MTGPAALTLVLANEMRRGAPPRARRPSESSRSGPGAPQSPAVPTIYTINYNISQRLQQYCEGRSRIQEARKHNENKICGSNKVQYQSCQVHSGSLGHSLLGPVLSESPTSTAGFLIMSTVMVPRAPLSRFSPLLSTNHWRLRSVQVLRELT